MNLLREPRRRIALLGGIVAGTVLVLLLSALVLGDEPNDEPADTGVQSDAATATPAEPTKLPPHAVAVNCNGTLQDAIDQAQAGVVLDMRACTYEGSARVDKPLTLIGGTLISPAQSSWAISLAIEANDVTIDGWDFRGGGNVISIFDHSNVQILNNSFRDHTGGAIWLWGAVRDIEIAGNDIVNTRTNKTGIIGGRGSEGSNPCPTVGRNVTIRDNYGDQGSGSIGWFGIELKCFEDVLIEGNELKGGSALISLPDSNRVIIRNNILDLTGSPYWGVEVPKAHHVTIEYNTVYGDGPQKDTAFSANSGSRNLIVRHNKVKDVKTLVDGPLGAIISDNCIVSVTQVTEYGEPETSKIERNAIC